jgi:hypothetical protein
MGHQTSEEELPGMASDHTLLLVGTTDRNKRNRKLILYRTKLVEMTNKLI